MARDLIATLSGGVGDGVPRVRVFNVWNDGTGVVTSIQIEADATVLGRIVATVTRPSATALTRTVNLTGTAANQSISLTGAWRWNRNTGSQPYQVNLSWQHPERVAGRM